MNAKTNEEGEREKDLAIRSLGQPVQLPISERRAGRFGLNFVLINRFGWNGIVFRRKDGSDSLDKSLPSVHRTQRILRKCLGC